MMSETSSSPLRYVGPADEETTVPDLLRRRAEMTPDARFVTCDGTQRTFAEGLDAARAAAAAFAAVGLRKGDTLAVMLPNCLEFLDVWFGSALLGIVLVPINTQLRGAGLRHIVEHSGATAAIVDAPFVEPFEAAVPAGVGPDRRFARGLRAAAIDHAGWLDLGEVLAGGHPAVSPASVAPGDLASVLYTSGTTGLPKGVMTCHNSYAVSASEYARRYVALRGDDVLWTCLPLFHINAQTLTAMPSLLSGRPMVLADKFSASRFWSRCATTGRPCSTTWARC